MHVPCGRMRRTIGVLVGLWRAMIGFPSVAQQAATRAVADADMTAASLQSAQAFRNAYNGLLDQYDQVYGQERDARGQAMVAKAKAAMQLVKNEDLAKVFSRSAPPDMAAATAAMQRLAALSHQEVQSKPLLKSLPFPSQPTVIDACNNTPHGDQITYDALIAFQVTSGVLAAAARVCNEDILGENGSAACIPLAIANDIASSFFSVRSFCAGLDTAATVIGSYDRLDHIHNDLSAAQTAITASETSATTAIANDINASTASIITNNNANTASIISTSNANTATIVNNANSNREQIVAELHALGCEIIRLLNTPEGQRASSILACSAQPGFPYRWNKGP